MKNKNNQLLISFKIVLIAILRINDQRKTHKFDGKVITIAM